MLNINLLKELDTDIKLVYIHPENDVILNSDSEQLRIFFLNLIKTK